MAADSLRTTDFIYEKLIKSTAYLQSERNFLRPVDEIRLRQNVLIFELKIG